MALSPLGTPWLVFIIPTLDSLAFLPQLVGSLQSQSWPHWSAVIVDGGSGAPMRAYLQELCAADPRFAWHHQSREHQGIFGAMNQGMEIVERTPAWHQAWLLFWGSDDWAAAPRVLEQVAEHLQSLATAGREPDLVVCGARYARRRADGAWALTRRSGFGGLLPYGWALRLGLTPPHQGTLFGPKVRRRQASYKETLQLSADLDYFLRLSRFPDVVVDRRNDLELVVMAAGGTSGQRNRQRFQEVQWAYQCRFGRLWWLSYGLRYLRRGLDASMGWLGWLG